MESEMYGELPEERAERLENEGRCRHCERTLLEKPCAYCRAQACPGFEVNGEPVCCTCEFEIVQGHC